MSRKIIFMNFIRTLATLENKSGYEYLVILSPERKKWVRKYLKRLKNQSWLDPPQFYAVQWSTTGLLLVSGPWQSACANPSQNSNISLDVFDRFECNFKVNNTKSKTILNLHAIFQTFQTIKLHRKVILLVRHFNQPSNKTIDIKCSNLRVIKMDQIFIVWSCWNNFRFSLHCCSYKTILGLPGNIMKSIFLINKLLFSRLEIISYVMLQTSSFFPTF